jgi:two-component system chemotaxis response regulator CheY
MPLTILHVEDHRIVADAVGETLELEGWRVVTCTDGAVAVRRLASDARYDLLMFDNHLPNVNGIELVRHARGLTHRQRTPIIMLSASNGEQDARAAGADAFLRKPQDIGKIVGTIKRLLNPDTG